jgi:hypothetical protein
MCISRFPFEPDAWSCTSRMNFQAAEDSRDQAAQGTANPRGEGSREFDDPAIEVCASRKKRQDRGRRKRAPEVTRRRGTRTRLSCPTLRQVSWRNRLKRWESSRTRYLGHAQPGQRLPWLLFLALCFCATPATAQTVPPMVASQSSSTPTPI